MMPTITELREKIADYIDSDIRLLVLASGLTADQFDAQFPDIRSALAARAVRAVLDSGIELTPEPTSPEHGADWSDWGSDHPEEGPSCQCGFNGSPAECASFRAHNPDPTDPGTEITFETRRELIERAVKEMTPMVTNETQAWNLWNYLATSDSFKEELHSLARPLTTEKIGSES